MWPWEHIAVAYLLYSGYVHVRYSESPGMGPTVAVALGALFPDLVDKPLAWTFGILPSGVSLAHSVFTALALSTIVIVVLGRLGHRQVGVGFSVAYLSHLPADALYPVLLGSPLRLQSFFWPLVAAPDVVQRGFLDNFVYYLVRFLRFLATEQGMVFLTLELVLLGTALLVWVADGYPGLGVLGVRNEPKAD